MTTHDQYRDDLPLLAAGALSPVEAAELEQHLAECAGCREEFAELAKAVSQVGIAQGGVPPPEQLRVRIMSQIAAPRREQAEKKSGWPVWVWAPVFASIVLAVTSLAYRQRVQRLESENQQLASQIADNAATLNQTRALFQTLTAPDAVVTLTSGGKAAPPEAKTIYSAKQHALVLTANNLPQLDPHKAYELWLLPENGGAPVAYGTFKPDSHGNAVLVMTALGAQSPKGFAVTVEAETGSSAPTSPIVLVGSV